MVIVYLCLNDSHLEINFTFVEIQSALDCIELFTNLEKSTRLGRLLFLLMSLKFLLLFIFFYLTSLSSTPLLSFPSVTVLSNGLLMRRLNRLDIFLINKLAILSNSLPLVSGTRKITKSTPSAQNTEYIQNVPAAEIV